MIREHLLKLAKISEAPADLAAEIEASLMLDVGVFPSLSGQARTGGLPQSVGGASRCQTT